MKQMQNDTYDLCAACFGNLSEPEKKDFQPVELRAAEKMNLSVRLYDQYSSSGRFAVISGVNETQKLQGLEEGMALCQINGQWVVHIENIEAVREQLRSLTAPFRPTFCSQSDVTAVKARPDVVRAIDDECLMGVVRHLESLRATLASRIKTATKAEEKMDNEQLDMLKKRSHSSNTRL